MKNLLLLPTLFTFVIGFSQTPITNNNFDAAIADCLATHPVTGLCVDSEYGPMPDWDVSNVTYMASAFENRFNFNGDIRNWNVSNVTNMSGMFQDANDFNQDIGEWDVSNVTNMFWMFGLANSFNQDIGNWDVSNVTDMGRLFWRAFDFNQDIGNWDVSNVTNMWEMFRSAISFNQDIGNWDVSNVTRMEETFQAAISFNQDIGDWDISNVTIMVRMLDGSGISTANYDAILQGWAAQTVQNNINLGAGGLFYCNAEAERQSLIDNFGWTIEGDAVDPNCNPCLSYPSPTGPLTQTFCDAAIVADLIVTGENIKWYSAAVGGNVLDTSTALINNQTVYASQTINGCESNERLAITVSIQDIIINASATEICVEESVDLSAQAFGTTFQSNFCSIDEIPITLHESLLGAWPFCGNANDVSGNNFNGTLNGGVTPGVNRFGEENNSYIFDGQPLTYISMGSHELLDITEGSISISAWVNTNNIGGTKTIVSKANNDTSNVFGAYNLHINGPANFVVTNSTSTNGYYSVISANDTFGLQWKHLTAVADIDNLKLRLYFDGQLASEIDWEGTYKGGVQEFLIGSHYKSDFALNYMYNFNGSIDDVAIWNRVLNQYEIDYLSMSNSLSYNWSTGDTTENITVTPTETTEYWVDVTTNGVTCREYITINVINPEITASATEICAGESVDLSVNTLDNNDVCDLPVNLEEGLIMYLPFCENAQDISGNSNNGLVSNSNLTEDRFNNPNQAYLFSNSNQSMITVNPSTSLNITQDITFSAWFYPTDTTLGYIIDRDVCGFTDDWGLQWLGGQVKMRTQNDENTIVSGVLAINNWYHVLVTRESGVFTMYIDSEITSQNSGYNYDFSNTNNPIRIGDQSCTSPEENFDGKIDDVAVWNRALSSDEVLSLYQNTSTAILWSTGETTENITVTPTETTEYWVDVTTNGVTCRDYITINVDAEDPTWLLPPSDLTVECNGTGNTTEFNNWLNNTFSGTDNCGSVTITTNSTGLSDDCGGTGSETVTFTLTDSNNNAITLDATFTIEDTTDPTMDVAASDSTIECDGLEDPSGAFAAWLANNGGASASDSCSSSTLPTDGLIGYWPFNGNANDESGNGNHGTVSDAILSTDRFGSVNSSYTFDGSSSKIYFSLNSIGNVIPAGSELTTSLWVKTSDLNGPLVSMRPEIPEPHLYEFMIGTLRDTEVSPGNYGIFIRDINNSEKSQFGSNVVDNSWQMLTIVSEGNGNVHLYKNGNLEASVSGNNGELNFSPDFMTFGAEEYWIVADESGCGSCNTIEEQYLNGQLDDIAIWNRALTVEEINNLYSANSETVTWSNNSSGLSDTCGATGSETVTFTATDACGNFTSTTATFTIVDTTDPTMDVAASDSTVECDGTADPSGVFAAWLADNGGAEASDSCSGVTWSNDSTGLSDTCGATGSETVTFTATDACGNFSSTTATFTIEDTTAPVIGCPGDVTAVTEDGDCGAIVNFQPAVAIDNCGSAFTYQTGGLGSGSVFPVGDTLIEYTAQDECGNLATCTFTVTVIDDDAPEAICQDLTLLLDDTGNATITADQLNFGSNDNCGVESLAINVDTFDCSNVGANEVTLTVTDIHGNTATCIANVTVLDNTAPIAVCQDLTLELGDDGSVTIDPLAVDGGSSDACGIVSYELNIDTLDCSNLGNTTVILTVTDANGNQSSCSATVTLEDNTPPVLVCSDDVVTVELNQDGVAFITPSLLADITDNCGTGVVTVDVQEVSCADIGTPVIVNVFANDGNGNSAVCSAVVKVVDLLAPEIVCPDDQVVNLSPDGTYTLGDYIADGSATATDNCTDPVTIFSQDPAAGSVLGFGMQVVTFTAEDEYGNVSTCSFELDIQEILGAGEVEDFASLVLYPNPADSKVNLSNPRQIDLSEVTIYDLTGRIVHKVDLSTMGSEITIDIATLANATYMLVIRGDQGISTKQLIVNNY